MDLQLKDGWLEVISGNMYAGKTEELLRRIKRIEYAKKSIIVFKPKMTTFKCIFVFIFDRQYISIITNRNNRLS